MPAALLTALGTAKPGKPRIRGFLDPIASLTRGKLCSTGMAGTLESDNNPFN